MLCVDCCVKKVAEFEPTSSLPIFLFFFVVGFLLLEGWFDELIYKEIYGNEELFSA